MNISIETVVDAPIETVWSAWVTPADIMCWNFASNDWVCPAAKLDLVEGGRFSYRMEARDGSAGFDFAGTFSRIVANEALEYVLDDDRKVCITFVASDEGVRVLQTFDADSDYSAEQQKAGWQRILDNFRRHVESDAT